MKRLLTALLLACVTLTCTPQHASPTEQLRFATVTYNEGLRWKRYADAASVLPAESRARFVRTKEDERDELFFVEYELRSVDVAAEGADAHVEVDYKWYRLPSTTLETTRMRQHWVFANDVWQLVDQEKVERKAEDDADVAPKDPSNPF